MTRLEVVESYFQTFSKSREFVSQTRASALTRLVWFVAISGYVLINGEPYWAKLAGKPLNTEQLFILSLPWLFAVFFSVVTHFLVDEVQVRDDKYFINKLATIDLHRIRVKEETEDPNEMKQLIEDTHPAFSEIKASLNKGLCWAKWFERLAFISILVGLVLAVVYPMMI